MLVNGSPLFENGILQNIIIYFIDQTETIEAKKKLKESEKQFRILYEKSPDLYFSVSPIDGKIILCNETAVKRTGYTKDEITGMTVFNLYDESCMEDVENAFNSFKKTGSKIDKELILKTKKGSLIPVSLNVNSVTSNKEILYSISCLRDISSTKKSKQQILELNSKLRSTVEELRATVEELTVTNQQLTSSEQELMTLNAQLIEKEKSLFKLNKDLTQSEERLRNIIDHSTNMFYSHTTDHRLTYVSPQVKAIIGIEPEEAMVKWTTFITDNPINEEGFKTTLKAIETGKAQPPYELELKRADGSIIWVEVREAPLIKNGKVTAIVGSLNDITKRKKAQQELVEREQFLNKIIQSTALSTWISDVKGYAIKVNPACLTFFGATEDEVLNKYCIFKDSVLIEKGLIPEIKRVYEKGEVLNIIIDYDFSEVDHVEVKNATHKIINSIFTPITDISGNITNVIVQTIDLTEIKESEKQLRLAKEKAEESDKLKSAFLANMSHEIRTPMNGIMGFTELLKQPDLDNKNKDRYIEIIQKSGERMLSTINDIIEISKIETGQIKPKLDEIDINNLLSEYFEFFKLEANKKGIKLSCDTADKDQHTTVKADEMMLNSILTNLIKNAIKYTEQGSINFGYEIQNNEIKFYVKDTGIGISKNEQKVIFDRFRQSKHSSSKIYEGSGLGLAISKAYVEMMNGKIWMESNKEQGSTFNFNLPFKKSISLTSENRSNRTTITAPLLKNKNVLIVEDDPFGTLLLNEILTPLVKKVYSSDSGSKAYDIFENHDIDIIMMDIKIPDINGLALSEKIEKRIKK